MSYSFSHTVRNSIRALLCFTALCNLHHFCVNHNYSEHSENLISVCKYERLFRKLFFIFQMVLGSDVMSQTLIPTINSQDSKVCKLMRLKHNSQLCSVRVVK